MGSTAFELLIVPLFVRLILIYLAMAAVRIAILAVQGLSRQIAARSRRRDFTRPRAAGRCEPRPAPISLARACTGRRV